MFSRKGKEPHLVRRMPLQRLRPLCVRADMKGVEQQNVEHCSVANIAAAEEANSFRRGASAICLQIQDDVYSAPSLRPLPPFRAYHPTP